VEEMVIKAKYINGCHNGRNDYTTESERLKSEKNWAITGISIVLAYP